MHERRCSAIRFLCHFHRHSTRILTPGITALAHLGCRVDSALFVRIVEIQVAEQERTRECTDQQKSLPLELWEEVPLQLQLPNSLVFGLVSTYAVKQP
jgi:hypothetical protein